MRRLCRLALAVALLAGTAEAGIAQWVTAGSYRTTDMGEDYGPRGRRSDTERGVYYVPEADLEAYRVHFTTDPDGVVRAKRMLPDGTLENLDTRGLGRSSGPDQQNTVIYVMDAQGAVYVIDPTFVPPEARTRPIHHSSVPNGQPVAGAGHIGIVDGVVQYIDNGSGHYGPAKSYLTRVSDALGAQGVDLATVSHNYLGFEDRPGYDNPFLAKPRTPATDVADASRPAESWETPDEGRGGSPATGDTEARAPPIPEPEPRVDPPSPDRFNEIRDLIRDTPLDQMDVEFMKRVYADPDAAKLVGQAMGDPTLSDKNVRMGELRAEMDLAVWREILRDNPMRIEFTNQGKSNGIRSDLDYTLYFIADEVGISIEEMTATHRDTWLRLHDGISPEAIEIAVMDGDAFYPDWRAESLTSAQYQHALRRNLRVLRSNPEAYFVPGANKQQVHNRALRDGNTTVLQYDVVRGELLVETGPAREIAQRYEGVHPQYDYKNALGNLIQNPREFFHHLPEPGAPDNATEAIRRSKYFNRVVNEGLGGLAFFANTYQEIERSGLSRADKDAAQQTFLRRALQGLGLSDTDLGARVHDFKRIADISNRIELDKVDGTGDYAGLREQYFADYRAEAEARVQAEMGAAYDPATARDRVLAEQERLFGEDQTRMMVDAMRAGLAHSARRDLTPEGARRNALRFETDPETGRPRAVFDPARAQKVAFERATEVALLFELVNTSNDPELRRLAGEIVDQAPTSELRDLYRQLSEVTTAQIDNFLKEGPEGARSRVGITIQEFIDQKLDRARAAGVDVVDAAEAERLISDAELRTHVIDARTQKMSSWDRRPLAGALRSTTQLGGELGREMWGKAGGLMIGSSAVNIARAYQTGDEFQLRHAVYTETLNFMPDVVEIPLTVLDAMLRSQRGDMSGFTWDLPLMGALQFVPSVGYVLLGYNLTFGSFDVARTYVVTRIDADLVEQALRSRPVDSDGTRLPGARRARRNPHKDSDDLFRGDPPQRPLFFDRFPVPEDTMSDYRLANQAALLFAGQIVKDLEAEGLDPESTAGADRARDLAWKYGFDLPYYRRMDAAYEHFNGVMRDYILANGAMEEDAELWRIFSEEVRQWYSAQPPGYQREFQGYFDVIFGSQEQKLLDQITSAVIAEYKQHELTEIFAEEKAREEAEALRERTARMATAEKQLLATEQRLRARIAEVALDVTTRSGQDAALQESAPAPVVHLSYPYTYATEEHPPLIDVDVRGLVSELTLPLDVQIEAEQLEATTGAPSGWSPSTELADRFEDGPDGYPDLVAVTVRERFRARVRDASGALVGDGEIEIPVVHYVPHPGAFGGLVAVSVVSEMQTEDGPFRSPYPGATVDLGTGEQLSDIYGTALFRGLDAGSYSIEVRPREGDDSHGEGAGSVELTDPRDNVEGEGSAYASITVVLPYSPPTTDAVAEEEDGGDEAGGGPGEGGGAGEGGNAGGGEEGGGEEGGEGEGPSLTELTGLTSAAEAERDAALAACDYPAALTAQEQVVADAEAWLVANFSAVPPAVAQVMDRLRADLAEIRPAADAVEAARPSLRTAQSQIQARDVEAALTTLESAMQVPDLPGCMANQIQTLYDEMMADAEALRRRTEEAAQLGNEACDYEGALQLARQIEADAPSLSWVATELPLIEGLAERQVEGRVLIGQAQDARNQTAWDEAVGLAQRALAVAPDCESDLIEDFLATLSAERDADQAAEASGDSGVDSTIPVQSSVVFLIDASGSMGDNGKMDQAKTAAAMSIDNMPPDVEMAVLAYEGGCSGGWRVAQGFTRDRTVLQGAVSSLRPGGGTPMAPAVSFAQSYIEGNARGASAQLMVLSDGQNDCGSTRDAGTGLRRSSVPVRVDAIGFGLPEGSQAENDLDELVQGSGNGARHSANSANELISAFRRAFIGQQLKRTDPDVAADQNTALSALFEAAREHLTNNEVRAARGVLENAARQVPASPAARYNLSLAYEAEGQLQRAVEQANHYLTLAPNAIDRGLVRDRIRQLEAQVRETPTGVFDPEQCQDLYRWAREESDAVDDPARKAQVFRIQNAAQRGECDAARSLFEAYRGAGGA